MTGLILTVGSIGVMIASGVAMSAAFKWLHEFEIGTGGKKSSKGRDMRGGFDHDKFDNLGKGLKGRN